MIEKDLAHLRFLAVRSMKGDRMTVEDLDFVLRMQEQIAGMACAVDDILRCEIENEKAR